MQEEAPGSTLPWKMGRLTGSAKKEKMGLLSLDLSLYSQTPREQLSHLPHSPEAGAKSRYDEKGSLESKLTCLETACGYLSLSIPVSQRQGLYI